MLVTEASSGSYPLPKGRFMFGTLLRVWAVVLILSVFGCSDDKICAPGDQKECACPGSTITGAQVCSDDGSKWGTCMGCDATDGDIDPMVTDGDDDTVVTDGDDATDPDPEPEPEPEAEPEPDPEPEPEPEPILYGTCAYTGEVCQTQDDCPQETLQGFIITRDDYPETRCAFEARFETGITYTCEGSTHTGCETDYDCPNGMFCGYYGDNWCEGNVASGVCSCSNCSPCQLSGPNVCVICGNDTIDNDLEECEDGNTESGDGCSNVCRFQGTCWNAMDTDIGIRCATDDDCDGFECGVPPCECRLDTE